MRQPRSFSESESSALSLPWIYILMALADGPKHGYGIMQYVEQLTNGTVAIWPATLYGAVKRMRKAGLVEPSTTPSPDTRRRAYEITPRGTAVLRVETGRLAALVETARSIDLVGEASDV